MAQLVYHAVTKVNKTTNIHVFAKDAFMKLLMPLVKMKCFTIHHTNVKIILIGCQDTLFIKARIIVGRFLGLASQLRHFWNFTRRRKMSFRSIIWRNIWSPMILETITKANWLYQKTIDQITIRGNIFDFQSGNLILGLKLYQVNVTEPMLPE